ncbi:MULTISPECIES: helix-turn-helix domain-containing protein [Paenibacillus]|nr:helix-turn-helix transcriptional regulator [Paenibacillus anaericanus]
MEDMHLARRIRAFRKLKGYTQQELADKSGVSLAILGAMERGNRHPEDRILNKIADILNVSLSELKLPK